MAPSFLYRLNDEIACENLFAGLHENQDAQVLMFSRCGFMNKAVERVKV